MQKEPTVAITQDERGQDWGWRKSCELHRKKVTKVDKDMEMTQLLKDKLAEQRLGRKQFRKCAGR